MFMDGNVGRLQGWLDKIERQKGPLAAFNAYVSLLEFHLPKRQRIDCFDAANPVPISLRWADGTPLNDHRCSPSVLPTST